jgi:transcriptional regulator with XRE-family HTH domain
MSRAKKEPGVIAQLKAAIDASGMTRYALAKRSGVTQAQLSRFMAGKRTLGLPAVEKICAVLRLTLVGEEPPTAKKRRREQ